MKKYFFSLLMLLYIYCSGNEFNMNAPYCLPSVPTWTEEQFFADQDGFYLAWQKYLIAIQPHIARKIKISPPENNIVKLLAENDCLITMTTSQSYRVWKIDSHYLSNYHENYSTALLLNHLFGITGDSRFVSVFLRSIPKNPLEPTSCNQIEIIGADISHWEEAIYLPNQKISILVMLNENGCHNYCVYGLSLSPFSSSAGRVYGINLSLLKNDTQEMFGLQTSIWANHSTRLNGLQTGLINQAIYADWFGFQIGIINKINHVGIGLQAGGVNIMEAAKDPALQIGIFNVANQNHVFGLQFGLLNYNGHFPLPLFNIVY